MLGASTKAWPQATQVVVADYEHEYFGNPHPRGDTPHLETTLLMGETLAPQRPRDQAMSNSSPSSWLRRTLGARILFVGGGKATRTPF
mmetsp:Transcript_51050/g.94414  ORF Transcript_51050/g.94414 Transcript_51050/m.94414 type:complete len:88 (-) Transcript_51050:1867-2130(-)